MLIVANTKVTLFWDVMPCSVCVMDHPFFPVTLPFLNFSHFMSPQKSFSEFFSFHVPSEILLSSLFLLDSFPFYPIKRQLSLGTPAVTQLLEETGSSEMKVPVY